MAEWLTIALLIGFGILLLVLEIIVIPGTTFVGMIGAALVLVGVALSFRYYGPTIGWTISAASALGGLGLLYYAFHSDAWSRFASKATISSKVNEGELEIISTGDQGVALSALRPVGKAEVKGRVYEVRTLGDYLESGKKVRVKEINSNQVIVEEIN